MSKLSGALFMLFFFMWSCKAPKPALNPGTGPATGMLESQSVQDLLDKVDSSRFNPEWMNGKASVTTISEGNETSFTINLRIRRDSVIWVSITPLLGIEVARVLITPDSVKFIDRLHKRYESGSIEYINRLLDMKVNFEIVQALLWGNFFAYKKNENRFNSVYTEDELYIVSSLTKRKLKRSLEEIDPNKPVIQDVYVHSRDFRVRTIEVDDQKIGKQLVTKYEDMRITPHGLFPFRSSTHVYAEKEIEIRIEYGKINTGEVQEFPFNIPNDYEKGR